MMENESIAVDILLVEDNPYDAEMTIRALRKKNLTNSLIHLKNGAEAIDFLFGTGDYEGRKISKNPKVILLDLKMPKLDGIQVLSAIRKDERTRETPVVVLTSSREDPDIRECYRLGVNSYIVKPVDFDKFIEAVSSIGLYWLLLNQPPVDDR
jgi:two-component system, response regulator